MHNGGIICEVFLWKKHHLARCTCCIDTSKLIIYATSFKLISQNAQNIITYNISYRCVPFVVYLFYITRSVLCAPIQHLLLILAQCAKTNINAIIFYFILFYYYFKPGAHAS